MAPMSGSTPRATTSRPGTRPWATGPRRSKRSGGRSAGKGPAGRYPRQREYPQPPPPSKNNTTRTIKRVSISHHLPPRSSPDVLDSVLLAGSSSSDSLPSLYGRAGTLPSGPSSNAGGFALESLNLGNGGPPPNRGRASTKPLNSMPLFVLRIPVRYYRHAPAARSGWRSDAPPRWGERWGHEWEQRRSGWDHWDRHTTQAPAPLPVYQRQYSGNRYPRVEQQQALHREKYRYEPQEPVVRQHYQQQGAQPQPGERKQQANQRSSPPPPPHQSAPAVSRSQPKQGGGEGVQRSAPAPVPSQQGGPAVQPQRQQPQPTVVQHEQPAPKSQGQGQEKGQEQERGQGRNK